jgi:molybdopterin converting factor small subunit
LKIRVRFLGILAQHARVDVLDLDLPASPLLRDLLAEIDIHFQGRFPFRFWDAEENKLAPGLFIRGQERDLLAPDEKLLEGEEIYFLLPMAGG